jgi:hypothetical protein
MAGHDRLMRIMKQADQGFGLAANTAWRSWTMSLMSWRARRTRKASWSVTSPRLSGL